MLLYLHIPFCDSKCNYCAFNSYVDKFELKKEYMRSICIQLEHELKRFKVHDKEIETIFIGGGTPSTIKPQLYENFFKIIDNYIQDGCEITTEANPNSATKDWIHGMKELGINRISFGVQSFDIDKLKLLGRNHSPDMAKQSIVNAYKLGIKNISLDLIYGTILDNKKLLKSDLDIAFSLPINHLSSYSLTIEEKTEFFNNPNVQNDDENIAKWFINKILKKGFLQYEISNFGTYICKHNLGYWQYKEYIGIGSGAIGFLKNRRFYTQKDIDRYIKNPTLTNTEYLTDDDTIQERLLLGLRSCVGFEENIITQKQQEKISILLKEKKLTKKNGRFYNNNYLLSDEIALFILS